MPTTIFKVTRTANEAFEKEKPVRLNPFRALTLQKRFNYEKWIVDKGIRTMDFGWEKQPLCHLLQTWPWLENDKLVIFRAILTIETCSDGSWFKTKEIICRQHFELKISVAWKHRDFRLKRKEKSLSRFQYHRCLKDNNVIKCDRIGQFLWDWVISFSTVLFFGI